MTGGRIIDARYAHLRGTVNGSIGPRVQEYTVTETFFPGTSRQKGVAGSTQSVRDRSPRYQVCIPLHRAGIVLTIPDRPLTRRRKPPPLRGLSPAGAVAALLLTEVGTLASFTMVVRPRFRATLATFTGPMSAGYGYAGQQTPFSTCLEAAPSMAVQT